MDENIDLFKTGTDPCREEKTAMMQRVNQAYAANDLLALQLEIEQIDASHIDNISAERLKHYNKALAEARTATASRSRL